MSAASLSLTEIADSPDWLQRVWTSAPDAMALSDAEGIVMMANPAYCELYGYQPEEIVGRSFAVIFPPAAREQAIQQYRDVYAGALAPPVHETRIQRKDGSERFVQSRAEVLVKGGQPQALLSIIRDITERKKLEEEQLRLRAEAEAARASLTKLFMEAPALIGILRGRDGVVELFNPPFRALWGNRDVLGKPMREAFPELDGQGWFEVVERVFETGESAFATEKEAFISRAGDRTRAQRFFNLVYQPVRERSGGEITGVAIYGIDVTDLVAARHEAEQSVALRDEFLAIASHELRTPLTSLRGNAALLSRQFRRRQTVSPERLSRAVDVIAHQADRLTHLVTRLLDVSRIRSGTLVLDRQPVDLVPLVHAAAAIVQGIESTGRIRVETPATLRIVIDPLRIEQILINLLDNAVKYSAPAMPIDIKVGSSPDGFAEIRVRDYGEGIPVESRAAIFDRFSEVRPNGRQNGIGLSLYLSRQLVELHGGKITAEHPEDGGTRFVIRLPLSMGR